MSSSEERRKKLIDLALDTVEGLIITDKNGEIVLVSQQYAKLMNKNRDELLGKNIKDVIPWNGMIRTCEKGKEEIGSVHKVRDGISVICNRFPLWDHGEVVGAVAFSTFRKFDEIKLLQEEINKLDRTVDEYKKELDKLKGSKYTLEQIIGNTPEIIKLKHTVEKIAPSSLPVLITGETGVGKELFAHALHQKSNRHSGHFIRVNCAAIPKNLLESELFGYEDGAFTGAKKGGKIGKFELAQGGSLLLDEINELPLELQPKLLRVLQEKELERVGGIRTIPINVRLIASANKNMQKLVAEGKFREDLYYRINTIELQIPPLRERIEDLEPIAQSLLGLINNEQGLHITGIKEDAMALLKQYSWPGNVRELKGVLERAAVVAMNGELGLDQFDYMLAKIFRKRKEADENTEKAKIEQESIEEERKTSLNEVTAAMEKEEIIRAIIQSKGNKSAAAKLLNIDRSVLYKKLKRYDIVL